MFATPEFWVLISFLLLLVGIGRKAWLRLCQALDAHAQQIADQLEEADRLQREALSLLQTYKEKHKNALAQSKKIIALSEKEAAVFKKNKMQDMDNILAQKEKALLVRLAYEREAARDRIRQKISEDALAIVKRLLSEEESERKALTRKAVEEIGNGGAQK